MTPNITNKKPAECNNIIDVRAEIDNIDRTIIQLLAERFEYVKEVVKYKSNTAEGIEASDRKQQVMNTRRQWAEENNISPDVVESIYKTLVEYFIEEEKKIINI